MAIGLTITLLVAFGAPVAGALLSKIKFGWLRGLFRKRNPGEFDIGPICLSDYDRVRHTHIVGATGSGKTVLLESLIYEDIRQGRGALIIDPKGDRELYDRIKGLCASLGRGSDLHLLSAVHLSESERWNPCRLGTAADVQTKLLNACEFSEVFYKKACESHLLNAVNRLASEKHIHLPSLVTLLKTKDAESHIQGLYFDFHNLIESEWKEILCAVPPQQTIREVSLLDVIRKNEILFVDLPTEGKSVQSGKIGKLLLQEIMLLSGMRKTYPSIRTKTPFSIYVDEFDAFATDSFATFLNKGRSSNFMIHLSHQTLADLNKISPDLRDQIIGNTNVRFVFRQDIPDDAEFWSKLFGTEEVVKMTYRATDGKSTGESSNRVAKEYRMHPDLIKELKVGECVFSAKSARKLMLAKVPLPKIKTKVLPLERAAHDFEPVPFQGSKEFQET